MTEDERQAERDREYESNKAQLNAQLEDLEKLGRLVRRNHVDWTQKREDKIEERQREAEEGFLCVEHDRTMRFVMCTGGPHAEIVWTEGRNLYAQCYGWFGAGKFERGLSEDEQAGFDQAFPGDFDELWEMTYRG